MKKVLLFSTALLIGAQAHAKDCTTQAALDQAVNVMEAELESELLDQATLLHAALKDTVPRPAYAQMQEYDRPLEPVQAAQVEASLASMLQSAATGFDQTSFCFRETHYNNGKPAGFIHWICQSRSVDFELMANNGMGQFTVSVRMRFGEGLTAPLSFVHMATVEERYNKIVTDHHLTRVIFPAKRGDGRLISDSVREDDLDRLRTAMAQRNQTCE
jgi:hypothetical protein